MQEAMTVNPSEATEVCRQFSELIEERRHYRDALDSRWFPVEKIGSLVSAIPRNSESLPAKSASGESLSHDLAIVGT